MKFLLGVSRWCSVLLLPTNSDYSIFSLSRQKGYTNCLRLHSKVEERRLHKGAFYFLPPSSAQNTVDVQEMPVDLWHCGREGGGNHNLGRWIFKVLSGSQSWALTLLYFLAILWNSQLPFSLDEVALCTKVVGFRAYAQETLKQKPPNANFNTWCKQDVEVIVLKSHLPSEKNNHDWSVLFWFYFSVSQYSALLF